MELRDKLKDLPTSPGVYLMLDEDGEIIYVGKAKNLRNRVRQYFQQSVKTIKVQLMVEKISDFRYIITSTEVEALVLENNLIKQNNPKYNILLKDDKSYPFVKINVKEDFPAVEVVRVLKKDGAKYFGPYMNGVSARDILDLLGSAFPLRTCRGEVSGKARKRPCLNYYIGRCLAPCTGKVTREEYHKAVDAAIGFLRGNDKSVEKILTDKMKTQSDLGNFEQAIFYRDKLKVLDKLVRRQIAALPNDFDLDVFAEVDDGTDVAFSVVSVRAGKIIFAANYSSENCIDGQITSFISQFYAVNPLLCNEIVVPDTADAELLEDYLSRLAARKINVIEPKQGVRKQLLDMAINNGRDYLENSKARDRRKHDMTVGAVSQLAEKLSLPTLPNRMECYDISHISGTDMVASMVVFKNGEPAKKHYRKFKIKTVAGNNDFQCMKEVLLRRLSHLSGDDESFSEKPDLIVVDGGKGQLTLAKEALREANCTDLPIVALAKREEELFLDKTPIVLSRDSQALKLLQRLRDEAHRFAVSYHRNLRGKRMVESKLEGIEGLGEKRRAAVVARFKTVEHIRNATKEELCDVPGLPEKVAQNIYDFFHGKG